jgi:hypothetical protein
MKDEGVFFHAKHAFMPNTLGYCGPDENGRLQRELEEGRTGEDLVRSLRKFEAAYPFLKLIARSTGRKVFDYAVPEAYWIGNSLLRRVPVPDFYAFSHRELQGKDEDRTRQMFKTLNGSALPHHTFYVMSTYAASTVADGPNLDNDKLSRLAGLMDNCRVSWGSVRRVGRKELQVEVKPLEFEKGRLVLGGRKLKRVQYNPEVRPFESVRPGAVISIHWNYACDVLTGRQARNIAKYTASDFVLVNHLLDARTGRNRK